MQVMHVLRKKNKDNVFFYVIIKIIIYLAQPTTKYIKLYVLMHRNFLKIIKIQ